MALWREPITEGPLELCGLTLAHTHLYSGLARGMAIDMGTPESFTEILERLWWRLDVALDEESLRSAALVALLDAAECGVTTVIDHHESPHFIDGSLDVLAEAAREVGVRLVTCYGSTDRHGAEGAAAGLRENERFARKVAGDPLVHAMVGLHACFTAHANTIADHVALAEQLGIGLHIHAAEDRVDSDAVDRLAQSGGLGARTLLAHGVHCSAEQLAAIARAEATIVHNPRSNQQNGVGTADVLAMQRAGVKVALGSDGMDGDLFTELRAAHLTARNLHAPQSGIDATALLDQGLALSQQLAGPAPNDAVVLDYDPPTPMAPDNVNGHLLFGIGARHVREVRVGGDIIVEEGVAIRVDAERIRAQAREVAARLWARL